MWSEILLSYHTHIIIAGTKIARKYIYPFRIIVDICIWVWNPELQLHATQYIPSNPVYRYLMVLTGVCIYSTLRSILMPLRTMERKGVSNKQIYTYRICSNVLGPQQHDLYSPRTALAILSDYVFWTGNLFYRLFFVILKGLFCLWSVRNDMSENGHAMCEKWGML